MAKTDATDTNATASPAAGRGLREDRAPAGSDQLGLFLVDRDLSLRVTLAVLMERHFAVHWSATDMDALWRLPVGGADILVVEHALPDIDAVTVVTAARRHRPEAAIIITGDHQQSAVIRELAGLGIAGYLPKPLKVAELIGRIYALASREHGAWQRRHPPGSHAIRAVHHVSQHFQDADPAAVARALGVSYGHLARELQAELDLSLGDCIARVRVEVAKTLVLLGKKLERIAEEVGFCDPSHLSRRFRQYVGCSPGDYRRSRARG